MPRQELKKCLCAKCKKSSSYFVIEDQTQEINLDNYLIYIRPILNVCQNCGYIATDLSKIEYEDANKNIPFPDQTTNKSALIYESKVALEFLNHIKDKETYLRVLSKVFYLQVCLYDIFASENFDEKIKVVNYKNTIKETCNQILSLINSSNGFKNNLFVISLQIEALSFIGEKEKANNLLNQFPFEEKLKNYLSDKIRGGNF